MIAHILTDKVIATTRQISTTKRLLRPLSWTCCTLNKFASSYAFVSTVTEPIENYHDIYNAILSHCDTKRNDLRRAIGANIARIEFLGNVPELCIFSSPGFIVWIQYIILQMK